MKALCPSASADAADAQVFGVVSGTADTPRIAYLDQTVSLTVEVRQSVLPATAEEVVRSAAPCGGDACSHYDGSDCTLVQRIVGLLDPVVGRPPPCSIRGQCRWWAQEGKAACLRCPQVTTRGMNDEPSYRAAMVPPKMERASHDR